MYLVNPQVKKLFYPNNARLLMSPNLDSLQSPLIPSN